MAEHGCKIPQRSQQQSGSKITQGKQGSQACVTRRQSPQREVLGCSAVTRSTSRPHVGMFRCMKQRNPRGSQAQARARTVELKSSSLLASQAPRGPLDLPTAACTVLRRVMPCHSRPTQPITSPHCQSTHSARDAVLFDPSMQLVLKPCGCKEME